MDNLAEVQLLLLDIPDGAAPADWYPEVFDWAASSLFEAVFVSAASGELDEFFGTPPVFLEAEPGTLLHRWADACPEVSNAPLSLALLFHPCFLLSSARVCMCGSPPPPSLLRPLVPSPLPAGVCRGAGVCKGGGGASCAPVAWPCDAAQAGAEARHRKC